MTLRERIANWILDGELIDRRVGTVIMDGGKTFVERDTLLADNARLATALFKIAAEAKRGKNPNATVRRMGKMAEDAL